MSYTYSQLKTAIQEFTDNTESTFVSNLNNFIEAAEQRILNSVDLQYFRANATGTLTDGNQYLAMPTDYLASFSLSITSANSKTFLLEKDVNFLQEYNPNSATTGAPVYYAPFDNSNFLLSPTPDSNYVTELHYFYRPDSLTTTGDSGTTWLSINAPNAMLYGSLHEAYIFMKGEPDLLQQYEKRFIESMVRLKDYAEARENSDAYRRGLPNRARS